MQLQQKTAKGSLWNLFRTLFVNASDFIVYAMLARVLSIAEFALIIFCLLIVEFASIFSRVGIVQNLIQRSSWEHSFSSSSFVFIALLSFLIACFLAVFGSLLAFVFYSKEAVLVVLGLSVIPLLVGLQVVFKAKMEREFRQATVTGITSFSTFISALLALLFIYLGYGLWALVVQKVVMNLLILSLLIYKANFKPTILFNTSHTKELVVFCLPLVYLSVLQYLIRKVNNFFAAVLLGAPAFAMVSIAKKGHEVLVQSTLTSVNNMVVPSLSRIHDTAKVNALYRLIELCAFIVIPCFIGLAAIAPEFVLLAFGESYESSAILLRIACFGIFAQIISWFIPNLLISLAETKLAMIVFVYELIIISLLAVVGIFFGVEAMLISTTVGSYLLVPIVLRIASKKLDISIWKIIGLVLPPCVASLVMFLSILIAKYVFFDHQSSLFLSLFTYILFGIVVYVMTFILFFKKLFFKQLGELKSSMM